MIRPAIDTVLDDLGVVAFAGPDAAQFLQGQLSQELARLEPGRPILAGYHNAQGRTIAVLRIARFEDQLLAVLPRELIADVVAKLRKFVLRAKVSIAPDEPWRVYGVTRGDAVDGAAEAIEIPLDASRAWRLARPGSAADSTSTRAARESWRALDIAAGLPQVYRATSAAFVAQMLNLDLLDGIAFDKGCYTGQEIIARAHYRGRVKRRLQRFRSLEPTRLDCGAEGLLGDGRSFKVVESVQLPDGRCEFLAVASYAATEGAQATEAAQAAQNIQPSRDAVTACEQLPLPYSLPA